jgi:acyl dehydratase
VTENGTANGTENGAEKRIVQRGLYFEEFEDGVVYVHSPGRTVTETDNVLFTTLTMNTQSLHLDAEWSSHTEFGERLINSMFTLSTMVGASVAQLTQGTIVANLGFTDVSFPHPVRAGDTMTSETRLLSKRLSASRPGQGIVQLEHTAHNQHGDTIARAARSVLMLCKPLADA